MKLASGILVLLLASPVFSASARLSATPHFALSGGVHVEAVIPRDIHNRRLRVTVDGPAYYRAFEEDMEGDKARVIYRLDIDQLPEGEYEVGLVVERASNEPTILRATFCRGSCASEP